MARSRYAVKVLFAGERIASGEVSCYDDTLDMLRDEADRLGVALSALALVVVGTPDDVEPCEVSLADYCCRS